VGQVAGTGPGKEPGEETDSTSLHRRAVLLVSKVRTGGGRYYLEPTGVLGGRAVEPAGYWIGRTRTRYGLPDEVEPAAFDALLEGRHPVAGEDLGAARQRLRVTAFDLTFCAPKSVSLLHALSEDDVSVAVGTGHARAVAAAMSYVEDRALAVRRVDPALGRVPSPVEVPPAAAYLHRSSRAQDPHLHTHVVVANIGRGHDRSWSALDGRGIYAHAGAAGAVYHAQLRHELSASLGVDWGPLRGGRADVAGVGDEARLAFSRRSAEIAAHLEARGLARAGPRPSSRAATVAALVTRQEKDLSVSVQELRPWWRERARAAGLGPRRLEAVLNRVPARALAEEEQRSADRDGQDVALAETLGSSRRLDAGFSRRHAVRAWAGSRPRGAPAAAVEERVDRFLASSAVVLAHADVPRIDGPGVAEQAHLVVEALRRPPVGRALDLQEQRRLEELVRRRGVTLGHEPAYERGRDMEGLALGR
jgi:conjugative relaxase-like TrwC/TraI family protein